MEEFTLHFVWRAENGSHLLAAFRAQVLEKDEKRFGRYLVRVGDLIESSWQGAPDESLLPYLATLAGKRCYVPPPALEGMRLPLKLATLKGQMRFFE